MNKMKTLSKKQSIASHVEDAEYQDEDVQELLFTKWQCAQMKKDHIEAMERQARWALYFGYDGCYAHNRLSCRQCIEHAR